MSAEHQVHALGAEQLVASEKEKVARAALVEENAGGSGDEQRALKRKSSSDPEEDDRAGKRMKASSTSPVSKAEEQAPITKRKSVSPARDPAQFLERSGNPGATGDAEIVRKRKASEEAGEADRDASAKKPKVSGTIEEGAPTEQASVAAARRGTSSELTSSPGEEVAPSLESTDKPGTQAEGKAAKRRTCSSEGDGGEGDRSKRVKITPADKLARKAGRGRRTTGKGAPAKSRKPGKPKSITAENVGAPNSSNPKETNVADPLTSTTSTNVQISEDTVSNGAQSTGNEPGTSAQNVGSTPPSKAASEATAVTEVALDGVVDVAEYKTSSSEVPSPGASNSTQSTSLTTPDQSFVGDSELAASVGIDSSPLGKRRRSNRSEDDELASQADEIVPPRGITNLKYSCYANALIQCAGKHFPDCYALLKESFPVEIPNVGLATKSTRSGTRSGTARASRASAALKADKEKAICLGAWVGDFIERIYGRNGPNTDVISSEMLHQVYATFKAHFSGQSQEDPSELLDWMMSQLHEEEVQRRGQTTTESFIEQAFRVHRLNMVRHCNGCGHDSKNDTVPGWVLYEQMPISEEPVRLLDLIDKLLEPKPAPHKTCDGCKKIGHCIEYETPTTTPRCLILQLTPSYSDDMLKIQTQLEMSFDEIEICGKRYMLDGIVLHDGIIMGEGHYTAFTKRSSQWFFCNDTEISTTTPEEIMESDVGQPFLLFFEEVRPNWKQAQQVE